MVTAHHEVLHRIFQERPEVLAPALGLLNVPLPEDSAVDELSPDCTEIQPVERRADTVLCVSPPGRRRFVLVVESQGRKDAQKPYSWAHYLSFLMAKHGGSAQLLVLCSNPATAKWAQGPFPLGLEGHESLTVSPWVLGPDNVPLITDADEAVRSLPLAVLSALVHRGDTTSDGILEALARALGSAADEAAAKHYMFMVDAGLDASARLFWRSLMSEYFPGGGPLLKAREREIRAEGEAEGKAEGKAEGRAEGKAEGRAEGRVEGRAEGEARSKAEDILLVLKHRGVSVTDGVRQRVVDCSDLDTLRRWFDRAFQIDNAEDLFTDNGE